MRLGPGVASNAWFWSTTARHRAPIRADVAATTSSSRLYSIDSLTLRATSYKDILVASKASVVAQMSMFPLASTGISPLPRA
jgi:hypothetical protein